MAEIFDGLRAEIAEIEPVRPVGRVIETGRGTFMVAGLPMAALGDRVEVETGAGALGGEIVRLSVAGATVLPEDDPQGLTMGARVVLLGPAEIAPDASWLGRIVAAGRSPADARDASPGDDLRAAARGRTAGDGRSA